MQEPSLTLLPSAPARYIAATRPGFLAASAMPVLIGLAAALHAGALHWLTALLTLIGAVAAQAGANVLNDHYDAHAGCDQINQDRVFPFTGGSRIIQNDVLSLELMGQYGWALLTTAALIGIVLTLEAGPGLILIGLTGLLLGWAYSAPPLRLCARGLGEVTVAVAFGVLIPVGAAFVQLGHVSITALWAGLPSALLIALVLYINQFPDLRADAATGKRNLVVRLGPGRGRLGYWAMVAGAYLILLAGVLVGPLPALALVGMLALPLHLRAGTVLWRHAQEPGALRPAIVGTLSGTLLQGLLTAVGLAAAHAVGGF
jgi:1,4-dihydroxy-2-naphthoate octaprenyltransferase